MDGNSVRARCFRQLTLRRRRRRPTVERPPVVSWAARMDMTIVELHAALSSVLVTFPLSATRVGSSGGAVVDTTAGVSAATGDAGSVVATYFATAARAVGGSLAWRAWRPSAFAPAAAPAPAPAAPADATAIAAVEREGGA